MSKASNNSAVNACHGVVSAVGISLAQNGKWSSELVWLMTHPSTTKCKASARKQTILLRCSRCSALSPQESLYRQHCVALEAPYSPIRTAGYIGKSRTLKMPVYNFKKMSPVPSAPDLVDIVLMRTQRKTPTVVHPGYKITSYSLVLVSYSCVLELEWASEIEIQKMY